jgi:hypothetical protein
MAAEQIPSVGARCGAPRAAPTAVPRSGTPIPWRACHQAASRWRAGEANSDGRVQAGRHGAPWRSGAKCEIRARTLGSSAQGHALGSGEWGSKADGRGLGRKSTAGGAGGVQNAISVQRPYGPSDGRCGRMWHGGVGGGGPRRRSGKSRSYPIRLVAGTPFAGTRAGKTTIPTSMPCNVRNAMQRLPPGAWPGGENGPRRAAPAGGRWPARGPAMTAIQEVRRAGRRGAATCGWHSLRRDAGDENEIPASMPCNVRTDGAGRRRRGADGRLEGRP